MWILAARTGAAILEIVGCFLVGLLGGQYVGDRLGSPDIGLWVGGGIGAAAAALSLRRLVRRLKRDEP